jgi:hypothetical protein
MAALEDWTGHFCANEPPPILLTPMCPFCVPLSRLQVPILPVLTHARVGHAKAKAKCARRCCYSSAEAAPHHAQRQLQIRAGQAGISGFAVRRCRPSAQIVCSMAQSPRHLPNTCRLMPYAVQSFSSRAFCRCTCRPLKPCNMRLTSEVCQRLGAFMIAHVGSPA